METTVLIKHSIEKDGLPENNKEVIAFFPYPKGHIFADRAYVNNGQWFDIEGAPFSNDCITHWADPKEAIPLSSIIASKMTDFSHGQNELCASKSQSDALAQQLKMAIYNQKLFAIQFFKWMEDNGWLSMNETKGTYQQLNDKPPFDFDDNHRLIKKKNHEMFMGEEKTLQELYDEWINKRSNQ